MYYSIIGSEYIATPTLRSIMEHACHGHILTVRPIARATFDCMLFDKILSWQGLSSEQPFVLGGNGRFWYNIV
jgi:hypothetical protein